jgi:hypothetical protein
MPFVWNRPDVPRQGWDQVGRYDYHADCDDRTDVTFFTCEMCSNPGVRWVYILEHPEYDGELHVGSQCAKNLKQECKKISQEE